MFTLFLFANVCKCRFLVRMQFFTADVQGGVMEEPKVTVVFKGTDGQRFCKRLAAEGTQFVEQDVYVNTKEFFVFSSIFAKRKNFESIEFEEGFQNGEIGSSKSI